MAKDKEFKSNGKHQIERDDEWAERKCLKCEKTFLSTWCGNRICLRCKQSGSFESYNYEHNGLNLGD